MNFSELKLFWVTLSRQTQRFTIWIFGSLLFRSNPNPHRILVFRTGSIGDNICAIPAMMAIRSHYNNARIFLLTDAGAQNMASLSVLMDSSYYDQLIDRAALSPRELRRTIKELNMDLVIELPQNIITLWVELRNMLFFRLAGIRTGFGWRVTTIYSFVQTQEKHLKFLSEAENLLDILKSNGVTVQSSLGYPLLITAEDKSQVERIVGASSITLDKRECVAVVPGAKRQMNRYPFKRFEELTRWLRGKGYTVIVVGGKEDEERGAQLERLEGVFSFCGKFTPIQSAILLSKCALTISNDTGPMHLSYAVGTPVIGLFSSRDFQEKWFPPKPSIALRNYDVHCSLCFSETCANNICMQGIPLDAVKNAFLELEASLK